MDFGIAPAGDECPPPYVPFAFRNEGSEGRPWKSKKVHGLDYALPFAPVLKYTSTPLLLATVALQHWHLRQTDVITSFLHGYMDINIPVKPPAALANFATPGVVCKLEKALYCLKQAPWLLYENIDTYLYDLGFPSCPADPCLILLHRPASVLYVSFYVDEPLIAGSQTDNITQIKSDLSLRFAMKNLGPESHWLDLEIAQNHTLKLLHASQHDDMLYILRPFDMDSSKPVCTPVQS